MRTIKLGLIQVDLHGTIHDDVWTKHDHLHNMAEQCLQNGADLVFFPEAYQYEGASAALPAGFSMADVAAKWKERCSALARRYNAYVAPWDIETASDGKRYNTTYILDRQGREIGRFRKVHLPYSEQAWSAFSPGESFPVFDLDFGKVGIMICFDNYFPESARALAAAGAELILYPLYGDTLIPQWELRMRARAVDNMVYIASSQIDDKLNTAYTGLVNPEGTVVCMLDTCPSWRVIEVEMGRQVITSTGGRPEYHEDLKQYLRRVRKPEAYGSLTAPERDVWDWERIFDGNVPKRPEA